MRVLKVQNVNHALVHGITMMSEEAGESDSRNGKVLVHPEPVTTVYEHPWERVLLSSVRDANPFFHLMESMWMLAGRNDVKFLSEFNSQMKNYSDDGKTFNAAYGHRMRNHFPNVGGGTRDQLEEVIAILQKDPDSRQAVVQLWDHYDLTKSTKDKACNMILVFSVRKGYLELTCYNRSNDMIWGAYGANAVHMSMFQEYVAAKLDLPMGPYYQVANNFHVYTEGRPGEIWNKCLQEDELVPLGVMREYPDSLGMNNREMDKFDNDLELFFRLYDDSGTLDGFCFNCIEQYVFESRYFNNLIIPMLFTYDTYKVMGKLDSIQSLTNILSEDWRMAAEIWLNNRGDKS